MTRTEKRHPKRFPKQRRKYLGDLDDKKHLNAYLKGKKEYVSSHIYMKRVKFPVFSQVLQQPQIF